MAIEWDVVSALDGIDEMRLFLDSPEAFGEKNYHVKERGQVNARSRPRAPSYAGDGLAGAAGHASA